MNDTATHWLMTGIAAGAVLSGFFFAWRYGLLG
jgi:hypothetical protein